MTQASPAFLRPPPGAGAFPSGSGNVIAHPHQRTVTINSSTGIAPLHVVLNRDKMDQPQIDQGPGKASRSGTDGLLLGGFIAGVLSFAAGFFLPMWLTPGSNQGPLTGCIMAPFAALVGAVLGNTISRFKKMTFLRATLIGILMGMGLVVLLYRGHLGMMRGPEGLLTLGCGAVIFGITGALTWFARP